MGDASQLVRGVLYKLGIAAAGVGAVTISADGIGL